MNNNDTALLVMDVQNGIINNLKENSKEYLSRVQRAVDHAHQNNIKVIFIVVRFRKGYPELSPNNKMFASIKNRFKESAMDEENESTSPAIKPSDNDLVITKKRVCAFCGNDLEMILKAQNIKKLVLSGVATSGVVLSTLRYAADRDYILSVLSDCCADHDDEVHRVLLEKIFPRQADVVTLDQWLNGVKTND